MSDLGKAYVRIVPSAEGISGSISSILDKEGTSAGKSAGINIAGGIGSALKGATSIVAAGAVAVTGALTTGAASVASYGDNIDKMSQKMGLSAQSYQEWDAVMQHSGTSMEAMKSSMKTLANAAQTNSAAFDALGISQKDLQNMSQEQLFEATITALQNVENETERTYLAGKTLGKGATELGALLNTSAEDTQAMRDRVHELGGVMSDEAVKAAAQFQDNLQDMQTAISGLGRGMISELLPSMNDIIAGFTSLILGEEGATEALTKGFEELFGSLDGIANNIIDTLTKMMPSIIDGVATILPDIIEMATKLLVSFAEALVQAMPQLITTVLPALLEAAVSLVVALGQALITAAPQLVEAGVQLFDMFKDSFDLDQMMEKGSDILKNIMDGITQKLPGILEKGIQIITNLSTGILNNMPKMIETAGKLITQFATFIMQNLPTILQAGTKLLLSLVEGIVSNLPEIITAVIKVVAQFVATIAQNLPQILQSGIGIIGELVTGLLRAIPQIISAIPQIISTITETLGQYDWGMIGSNILEGIKNGILGAIGGVVDAAIEAGNAIWNAVTGFFEINSPSKKMAWVGKMDMIGLAEGIEKNSDLVEDAFGDINNDATSQLTTVNAGRFSLNTSSNQNDNKMDLLIEILMNYLPEIAEKGGISAEDLYNGLNRQLGWAIS